MLIILRGYWLAWLIGWQITCCRPQLRVMFWLFGDAATLISYPGFILEAPLRWNRRRSASEALVVLWEAAHHLSRCERNRRRRRHYCCCCKRRIKFIVDLGRGSLTKQSPLALSLVARSSSAEGICSVVMEMDLSSLIYFSNITAQGQRRTNARAHIRTKAQINNADEWKQRKEKNLFRKRLLKQSCLRMGGFLFRPVRWHTHTRESTPFLSLHLRCGFAEIQHRGLCVMAPSGKVYDRLSELLTKIFRFKGIVHPKCLQELTWIWLLVRSLEWIWGLRAWC